MNVEVFKKTGNYFNQSLNLIVYAYEQIKKDKLDRPYSRCSIYETISEVRKSNKSHNEIEDFLRNDMVDNYLKRLRHLFKLDLFSIQSGVEEFKKNVRIGIVDIKFELISDCNMDGTSFVFECKRINKYAEVSNFKYSYLSKHIRSKDNKEISIHHLLLDYYDILVS
jgi:hypothetical protein